MKGEWITAPNTKDSVVFVHGVLSDGKSGWTHPNGCYWPNLLSAESNLAPLGIYVFIYNTGFFSGSYSLSDAVDALKEHMKLDRVSESRRLIFVCHSMGGIVVRKYIVERAAELIENQREIGLFLLASPSLGSSYADWLSPVARFLGHSQADALRFVRNNIWLSDLDREFKNLKELRRLRIVGKELVEDSFIVLRGLIRRQAVEPFAGAVYFGESFKVAKSDHFSIAKPEDATAIQHRLLCEFIRDFQKQSATGIPGEILSAAKLITSAVMDDRRQGIRALGRMDSPASTEALVESLQSGFPDTRLLAAIELAKRHDKRATNELVRALLETGMANADSPNLPKHEIFSLLESFGAAIVSDIGSLTEASDARVRAMAASALGRIGDKQAIQFLRVALDDESVEVKGRAIDAVALIKPNNPSVIRALISLLSDSTEITHNLERASYLPRISDSAYIALRELDDAEARRAVDEYEKLNAERFKEVKAKTRTGQNFHLASLVETAKPESVPTIRAVSPDEQKIVDILRFKGKAITVFNKQKYGHGYLEGTFDAVLVDCDSLGVVLKTAGNELSFSLSQIEVSRDLQRKTLKLTVYR